MSNPKFNKNKELTNAIISKIIEFGTECYNYIQGTLTNLKRKKLLDEFSTYATNHPLIALFFTSITCICSIPLIIFILFAVFTTIITFSGFLLIEGAILTFSTIILCGVLLGILLVFITIGISGGIFYYGMLKIYGLINSSPEESPVGFLIKSQKIEKRKDIIQNQIITNSKLDD